MKQFFKLIALTVFGQSIFIAPVEYYDQEPYFSSATADGPCGRVHVRTHEFQAGLLTPTQVQHIQNLARQMTSGKTSYDEEEITMEGIRKTLGGLVAFTDCISSDERGTNGCPSAPGTCVISVPDEAAIIPNIEMHEDYRAEPFAALSKVELVSFYLPDPLNLIPVIEFRLSEELKKTEHLYLCFLYYLASEVSNILHAITQTPEDVNHSSDLDSNFTSESDSEDL